MIMQEGSQFDKKSIRTVTEKTADFNELAKDCVAFANAKGGHLYIGIEDEEVLPPSAQNVSQTTADKLVRRMNELTVNVAVKAEVCKAENGGEFIDLTVFLSNSSIASTTKGGYFLRDDDKSRALLPDELSRMLSDKQKPLPFEGDDFVKVTVNRKIGNKETVQLCDYVVSNYPTTQKGRITLGFILGAGKMSAAELSKALQLGVGEKLDNYVGKLVEDGIISFTGRGKGCQYFISPNVVSNSRSNIKTSLRTIEPYRLRALILEDLRFHPDSLWSEIAMRLPDVKEEELQRTVRKMALDGAIIGSTSRKFRRYRLP